MSADANIDPYITENISRNTDNLMSKEIRKI